MEAERWNKAKEIFNSALELSPELRGAYVDEKCGSDPDLLREVDQLLHSYDSEFLEGSPDGDRTEKLGRMSAGDRVGHYEIVRLLGVGGMGEVYLAHDENLERRVAIKVLSERLLYQDAGVARFVREAKAASALNHPNILTIHEIGETDGANFIVSEYVDGKTLRDVLNERRLQLPEILDVCIQMASALAAAHSANIIHRDIKPENVIVREDGLVKILDFGLAKLIQQQPSFLGPEQDTLKATETTEGLILGTVSYMSPEQARGEAVDARTDVFSLGVVLYEMIAGRTPFDAGSMSEKFANLINKEPPPLADLAAGVPEDLQRIVSKMLRKPLDERYQTMKEISSDLKRVRTHSTNESKIDRTDPQMAETTAVFRDTANPASRTTDETTPLPARRPWRVAAFVAIPLLLIGILTGAWYWQQQSNAPPQIKSLAVLPLKSVDPGENYFGFAVADAVIRRISQTGALTVRPTSAVKRYLTEDIDALSAAQQLSVDAILDGTVQRVGDTLRVTVNLLRSSDGVSLWTEKYETQATDIFAVQDKVAQQVAARLRLQLDPAQQARLAKRTTSDPIAYDYYVKGVYAFNQRQFGKLAKEQIDSTIDLLKKAIDHDPNYALAHAKLAHAYAWKGYFIDTDDQQRLVALAKEEIAKADDLDTQLAETHLARFRILFTESSGWQIEEAAKEVLLAQQIDPNLGHEELADIYLHIGLEDLMDREIRKALEIDPTSEWVKQQMLFFYILLNRYDDYLIVKNEHFPEIPIQAGYFLVKGNLAKTKELLDEEEKKDPRGANPVLRSMQFAMEGRKRESEALVPAILKEVDRLRPSYHHDTYDIVCIYAMNGNVPEAMKWLRETATKGNPSYTLFNRDPFLDKIRQSPEFVQFMAELKPQYDRYRAEFK